MVDNNLKILLIKANQNYKAAELLIYSKNKLLSDGICINSEICIERFLKSFLIFNNHNFNPHINLVYLNKLCSQIDSNFENFNLQNLIQLSNKIRSENEIYFSTDKEALEFYIKAIEVKNFVLQKLNLTEKDLIL